MSSGADGGWRNKFGDTIKAPKYQCCVRRRIFMMFLMRRVSLVVDREENTQVPLYWRWMTGLPLFRAFWPIVDRRRKDMQWSRRLRELRQRRQTRQRWSEWKIASNSSSSSLKSAVSMSQIANSHLTAQNLRCVVYMRLYQRALSRVVPATLATMAVRERVNNELCRRWRPMMTTVGNLDMIINYIIFSYFDYCWRSASIFIKCNSYNSFGIVWW